MIDSIQALTSASLASALKSATETEAASPVAEAAKAGANFADFMSNISSSFVNNIKDAETKSVDGIMGKASLREVVDSVMTADQTLQTAMAFRDKIVSAYLEVVKMPI
jgi:flagellar hook-basal body complex protein FliE